MPETTIHTACNDTCPWSGKPVSPDSLTLYRGTAIGFCNPGCRDKFERATRHFDAAIDAGAGPSLRAMAGLDTRPPPLGASTLIVVDAQEEYRGGALPLAGIGPALDVLGALLERARSLGTPVIHVLHRGTAGGLFDPEGPFHAPVAAAVPRSGETIVEKTLPNAFAGTALAASLAGLGNRPLVLAGFMTHMCISSTARAALDLGHRVTIAADATATRSLPDPLGGRLTAAEMQRAALAALADRFAGVVRAQALTD